MVLMLCCFRFDCQLQQWLSEDTGLHADTPSLPLYLPQTLVSVPQTLAPVRKTFAACGPQVRAPDYRQSGWGKGMSWFIVWCYDQEITNSRSSVRLNLSVLQKPSSWVSACGMKKGTETCVPSRCAPVRAWGWRRGAGDGRACCVRSPGISHTSLSGVPFPWGGSAHRSQGPHPRGSSWCVEWCFLDLTCCKAQRLYTSPSFLQW